MEACRLDPLDANLAIGPSVRVPGITGRCGCQLVCFSHVSFSAIDICRVAHTREVAANIPRSIHQSPNCGTCLRGPATVNTATAKRRGSDFVGTGQRRKTGTDGMFPVFFYQLSAKYLFEIAVRASLGLLWCSLYIASMSRMKIDVLLRRSS
jgi:hypothetical protein